VAAFSGEVRCVRGTGAVRWRLSGADRDGPGALDVMLCGVPNLQLPDRLHAPELHVSDESANPVWELRSADPVQRFAARSVQVHRGADGALPVVTAPWTVRAGWALLLNALRLPGVVSLLRRLRGGNNATGAEHHG
jgi:hypothetical protein